MPYRNTEIHCMKPECDGHLERIERMFTETEPKIQIDPIYACSDCGRKYYNSDFEPH